MSGWGAWNSSWLWSLLLVAITIAMHVCGIVSIAYANRHTRARMSSRGLRFLDSIPGTIVVITATALSLAILHVLECLVWAVVYLHLGALPTPADATLYSVDSMTTRGASGLFLAEQWRMMGAAEAGDGMLLFGFSTAFLFTVLMYLWKDDRKSA
jgi:hypothetical protein